MPEPLRLRVQRPDGTPVVGARVLVAVRGEPFAPRPGGTVKTAPVELTTDAAGCVSYGEARISMPRAEPLAGAWGAWVADLDDRMTGACR